MKNVRSLTRSLLCASLCLVGGFAEAQQPAARQAAPAAAQATAQPAARQALFVGVIDMRAVLERHPAVADQMPELIKKLQGEEARLAQARQEADKDLAKIQAEFEVGSQEYGDRSRAVREKFTAAGFEAQEAQEAIVAQRTKLLYQAYTDVQDAIKTVAQQYGVLIVHSKIKFNADGKIPEEVVALQEADQNPIVWNRPECDITDAVIKQLAAKVGAPKTKAGALPAQTALSNVGQQAMQAANAPAASRAAAPNAASRAAAPRAAAAPNAAPRR